VRLGVPVSKHVSPLVGYNNNVRHKGRTFHVQTEDSGAARPRITTHLFADGGRILKSTRTDYSEHLGREDLAQVVRQLMKEQHKAMFIGLRDGHFDAVIATLDAPQVVPEAAPRVVTPAATAPRVSAESIPRDVSVTAGDTLHAPIPPPDPRFQPRPAPTLQGLSLASLGAPTDPSASPVATAVAERPPTGHTPRHGVPAVPAPAPSEAARYGASRPAAIFEKPTVREGGASLFGSNEVSEQSLDEVILSYLAEDLDAGPESQ
jgi:hypothetical protein